MARRAPGGADRKALQLAAQIRRSLELTLVGECRDEVLNNLSVDRVEPAPGNRMLVTLIVHAPGASMPKDEVRRRLELHRGQLIERLAYDVHRRGLPELSFWLVRDPSAALTDHDEGEDPDASSSFDDA